MFKLNIPNWFFLFALFFSTITFAQRSLPKLHFLEPSDTLNKSRLWVSAATGTAVYGGFSVILWNAWYKNFPLTKFHTFDDFGEWEDMDKIGHFSTAFIESNYSFKGALWTGMKRRKAMWVAASIGMGLQMTVEVMDGFSQRWGFSWSDVGLNALGVSFFVAQELVWKEQRIIMKISSTPRNYPDRVIRSVDGGSTTTLAARADELYGGGYATSFFKDYNAQTLWASANIRSFFKSKKNSRFPGWLNLAFGYGAENMYGGFGNSWSVDGAQYILDPVAFPRYRQFFLSFDVDMSRLKIRKRWLKTLVGALNWIKIPAPVLEVNTLGNVKFRPVFW